MTKINEMSAYKYNAAGSTSSSKGVSGADETSEAFMGLLLAQMRNQSPMDPMDDNQMISQMAQLNSLQELQSISSSLKLMTESNKFLSSAGLIGKYAKYTTKDEEGNAGSATGKISSVSIDGDAIVLTIGGKSVSLGDLSEVSETAITIDETDSSTAA
jgi:flagellar basal-body rod modification protein FlgD